MEFNQEIISLISGSHDLFIKELDGERLFYSEEDLGHFPNSDYYRFDFTKPGVATPLTPIAVGEMKNKRNLKEIFGALPGNWNERGFTQDQIIEFCRELPDWLLQGKTSDNATIFPMKIDENEPVDEEKPESNIIAVIVCITSKGRNFFLYQLGPNFIWSNCRIVFKKL